MIRSRAQDSVAFDSVDCVEAQTTCPNLPVLKGIQVVFQTLAFDANNFAGTFEVSNGLHWTIGN